MHNYLLTGDDFTFVPAHDNPVAIQENTVTQEYLVNAISTYLENFGPSLAASVVTAPPTVTAIDPAHPVVDYLLYPSDSIESRDRLSMIT